MPYTGHRSQAVFNPHSIPCILVPMAASASRQRKKGKTWSGRFAEPVDELREALHRLGRLRPAPRRARHRGLAGARAHARRRGVIGRRGPESIERGLAKIRARDPRRRVRLVARRRGRAPQHRAPPDRARRATPASGCTPARSRNDQVATDVRLWLRDEIDADRRSRWPRCEQALLAQAARHAGTGACPASRTCRSRSRSPSATTCSPTSRCSGATARASRTAAGA